MSRCEHYHRRPVTGGSDRQAGYLLVSVSLVTVVDRVAAGTYKARPVRVFAFQEIQEAHRLMESNAANGKIVVTLA